MVVATLVIGLAPTFEQIGVWAAVILFSARIVQGISLGGEFGGAMSYLIELAPPGKRGLYGSWQIFAAGLGLLAGAVVGTILTSVLSESAVADWGWRVAFLLAVPAGLVGLYIRLKLEDTPRFRELERSNGVARAPLKELFSDHRRSPAVASGIVVVFTVAFSTWHIYLPAYMVGVVGMQFNTALTVGAICLGVFVCLVPLMGILSDRIGRRPLTITGTVGLIALSCALQRRGRVLRARRRGLRRLGTVHPDLARRPHRQPDVAGLLHDRGRPDRARAAARRGA